MDPSQDRRRFPRLPFQVEVELYCPGHPVCRVWTEDLSKGGVLLMMDGQGEWPAIGTRVQIRVAGLLECGERGPLVEATVVRHTDTGIALSFDQPCECQG